MAKKTLKANLSVKGIEQLRKELQAYQDNIIYKTRIFAEKLAERGVEVARVKVADFNAIFTSELLQSIHSEYLSSQRYGAIFAVITDSSHAAFVEFGTGQRGIDKPYPYKLPDGVSWEYAVGKTIRQNPVTGNYYWFYPDKSGQWHYTEGMPARPFMYETSLELIQEIPKVAKEVFG